MKKVVLFCFIAFASMAQKEALKKSMDSYLQTLPSTVSVSVSVNCIEDKKLQYHRNASRLCIAASLIKLPVFITVLQAVEDKTLSLSDDYVIKETDICDQDGAIHLNSVGQSFSIKQLCDFMMTASDNSATNILIGMVTKERINAFLRKEDFQQIYLNRLMMDTTAMARGIQNFVSPREYNILLMNLYKGNYLNKKHTNLALDIMKKCADKDALMASLPDKVEVAHKTGTLKGIRSDCGIVYAGSHYAISTIVENAETEAQANAIIASLSKIAYDVHSLK